MRMTVYCALNCNTPVVVDVHSRGGVAGEIDCLECGGDGDWTKFYPGYAAAGSQPCVVCKGTGKQLVSI